MRSRRGNPPVKEDNPFPARCQYKSYDEGGKQMKTALIIVNALVIAANVAVIVAIVRGWKK